MRNIYTTYEKTLKQEFTDRPTVMRDGKEVDIQDHVQGYKGDCEVYSIMEKYGAVEKAPFSTQVIEGDLAGIKNLRDLKEAEIKAEKAWKSLPLEERARFGNNIYEFRSNGFKYYKELNQKIAKEQAELAKKQAELMAQAQQTGGQANAE